MQTKTGMELGRELFITILFCLLLSTSNFAQVFNFKIYSSEDGLPSPQVNDIQQDNLGRMWFATRNGIAVYDGLGWQYISSQQGLATNVIKKLLIDPEGGIWAIPQDLRKGLFRGENGCWLAYPFPEALPVLVASKSILVQDACLLRYSSNPSIWVACDDAGLIGFHEGTWTLFNSHTGAPFNQVYRVAAFRNRIYLATEKGAYLFFPDEGRFRSLAAMPQEPVYGVFVDSTSRPLRVWWAGEDWLGFLEGDSFALYKTGLSIPILYRPYNFIVIHPTELGDVFVGNPYRLYWIQPSGAVLPLNASNGLAGDGMTSFLSDREGNLWIGSLRGVSKLVDRSIASFTRFQGFLNDEVTAIARDRDGRLYFGHYSGVSVMENLQVVEHIVLPRARKVAPYEDRIMDLLVDQTNTLWIVSSGCGVWQQKNNLLRRIPVVNEKEVKMSCIFQDGRGRIWLGTYQGLFRLQNNQFVPVTLPLAQAPAIRTIQAMGDSVLLLASTEGLLMYWPATGKIRRIGSASTQLNNTYCTSIIEGHTVLVGTLGGLCRVEGDSLAPFPLGENVLQVPTYFIQPDKSGQIWIGTDRGVYCWNSERLRHFGLGEGLAGLETNREAVLLTEQGEIWFGTDQGASIYRPQFDLLPRNPPLVQIRQIQVNGKSRPLTREPLRLDHRENNLQIAFSVLSFVNEKAISIKYRLVGYEMDWIEDRAGFTRLVRYTNLPPGTYRFQVLASNASGIWSDVVQSVPITIDSPIWQKPWFLLLLISVFSSAAYGGVRFVAAQQYKRNLEREVQRRTRELKTSEFRYRRLFENTHDVIFACDLNGIIQTINPAGARVFGYPCHRDMIGLSLQKDLFVKPQDFSVLQKEVLTQGMVRNRRIQMKARSGEERLLRVSVVALQEEDGQRVQLIGFMRDETELSRLEQQFYQAQKMESIALLAGGIAHDFNNLLGGILGYASFLKMKLPDHSPLYTYVDTIEQAAKRGATLTSQLLAFSRKSHVQLQPVDLNRVVKEAIKLLSTAIHRATTLKLDLEENLPPILADESQIHQVVMNLCLNARDAIPDPEKGEIRIRTRTITLQKEQHHLEAKEGRYVVLSVQDNGIGMDEATRQRIFEPFFTTKGKGKGTGLGLAMVYGVVKNHEGFVLVDSTPGRGSTFSLYFPATEQKEAVPSEDGALPGLGGQETILVVDDEAPMRNLLKEVLEEYGYSVLIAEHGEQALQILSQKGEQIDLMVLDMVMPRMSGKTVLEQLKKMGYQIPVLINSGYSTQLEEAKALYPAPMDCIAKPFQVPQILYRVRALLRQAEVPPES